MKKFAYIEDYLLFIAGAIDINGKPVWLIRNPPISLASYDTGFIHSVAEQIVNGTALSDRQASLAEKIITNYARQLRKHGVEQPDTKDYRLGQRIIDRTVVLTQKDDLLLIKFPYDVVKISAIKEFAANEAQGRAFWSKDDRAWCSAITEYNLSWLVAYAEAHKIPIDPSVKKMFAAIEKVEQEGFSIELKLGADGVPFIDNAPASLQEYIENNIGFDDIYALIDSAGVLGYTVGDEFKEAISVNQSPEFLDLCCNRVTSNPTARDKYTIDEVVRWAKTVNRLPIVVYNPNFLIPKIDEFKTHFSESEICVISNKPGYPSDVIDPTTKLVYTNKVIKWDGRLPLVVSYANLMHSEAKRNFMNKAEKIVYLCDPLPKR